MDIDLQKVAPRLLDKDEQSQMYRYFDYSQGNGILQYREIMRMIREDWKNDEKEKKKFDQWSNSLWQGKEEWGIDHALEKELKNLGCSKGYYRLENHPDYFKSYQTVLKTHQGLVERRMTKMPNEAERSEDFNKMRAKEEGPWAYAAGWQGHNCKHPPVESLGYSNEEFKRLEQKFYNKCK